MVRTKANSSGDRKAVAAKAPRKQVGGSSGGASSSSGACLGSPNSAKSKYAGGNAVKWWPAPSWQKGIGQFFSTSEDSDSSRDNRDVATGEQSSGHSGASSTQQATSSEDD